MMDGAKHFLRWQMDWDLHTNCVNANFDTGAVLRLWYDLKQALDYNVK